MGAPVSAATLYGDEYARPVMPGRAAGVRAVEAALTGTTTPPPRTIAARQRSRSAVTLADLGEEG